MFNRNLGRRVPIHPTRWIRRSIHQTSVGLRPHTASVPSEQETLKVVFSGIQPTGIPHLGNYLGAVRQWVDLQNSSNTSTKLFFCIVDLHAITQLQDPERLRQNKKEMLATLIAAGLDPERCTIFEQSSVAQHAELMWVLSCGTSTGYLSRMTQWKSKLGISGEQNPFEGKSTAKLKLGLFSYPVLQAADILLYRATDVPVGEDQAQHLELTREIASSFHHIYGQVFTLPNTMLSPAKRVMSLRDPTKKMSKSDNNQSSRILLTDSPSEVSSKLKKAVTDSMGSVTYDRAARPGVSNLIEIYANMQGRSDYHEVATQLGGMQMKELKETVAACVNEHLIPIKAKYSELMGTEEGNKYLEKVAADGARKARRTAEETMFAVRKAVGLA